MLPTLRTEALPPLRPPPADTNTHNISPTPISPSPHAPNRTNSNSPTRRNPGRGLPTPARNARTVSSELVDAAARWHGLKASSAPSFCPLLVRQRQRRSLPSRKPATTALGARHRIARSSPNPEPDTLNPQTIGYRAPARFRVSGIGYQGFGCRALVFRA